MSQPKLGQVISLAKHQEARKADKPQSREDPATRYYQLIKELTDEWPNLGGYVQELVEKNLERRRLNWKESGDFVSGITIHLRRMNLEDVTVERIAFVKKMQVVLIDELIASEKRGSRLSTTFNERCAQILFPERARNSSVFDSAEWARVSPTIISVYLAVELQLDAREPA